MPWIKYVKQILDNCGFSNIWQTENFMNNEWLKLNVKQRLLDQFIQNWNTEVFESSKALNYRIYKTKFEFEEYFNILSQKQAKIICRFRTTNHHLPIETGRWQHIARENRYCHLCNSQKLGDEFHYILECTSLSENRKKLIPRFYLQNFNTYKFSQLMSSKKQSLLQKLCTFIKDINSRCITPG